MLSFLYTLAFSTSRVGVRDSVIKTTRIPTSDQSLSKCRFLPTGRSVVRRESTTCINRGFNQLRKYVHKFVLYHHHHHRYQPTNQPPAHLAWTLVCYWRLLSNQGRNKKKSSAQKASIGKKLCPVLFVIRSLFLL